MTLAVTRVGGSDTLRYAEAVRNAYVRWKPTLGRKSVFGCHLENIPPSSVCERPTPLYPSGIRIASNNDYAGCVPELILKGVAYLTIVTGRQVIESKGRRSAPTPHPNEIVTLTVTLIKHPRRIGNYPNCSGTKSI